jgi:hypothetical protein
MFLKGKDQDDAAQQTRKAKELAAVHFKHAVHKKDLSKDQDDAKGDQDDLFNDGFGLAFDEAENGDKEEEYPRKGYHSDWFFHGFRSGVFGSDQRFQGTSENSDHIRDLTQYK